MAIISDVLMNPDATPAASVAVRFRPLDFPALDTSGRMIRDGVHEVLTNGAGALYTTLNPGRYEVSLGADRARILIEVPSDGDTYTLGDVTISTMTAVDSIVPSGSRITAADMRFMVTVIQDSEVLNVPARRQHIVKGSLTIEPGGILSVADGGSAVIL